MSCPLCRAPVIVPTIMKLGTAPVQEETMEDQQKALDELNGLIKHIRGELTKLENHYSVYNEEFLAMRQKIDTINITKKMRDDSKNVVWTWSRTKHEWSEEADIILRDTFGLKEFRPQQIAAINALMSGKDVLLLMPTGCGKSLVYQIVAQLKQGFTLVVSPLISLMQDQLMQLDHYGIPGFIINSVTNKADIKRCYEKLAAGEVPYKLIYCSPEWLHNAKTFMNVLTKCVQWGTFDLIAIDEVHCMSTWGHDFRPDYCYLGIVRDTFLTVPVLGVTATASDSVVSEVTKTLGMEDALLIAAPFNRANLTYAVVHKPIHKTDTYDYLGKLINDNFHNESGIIYASTVNNCNHLSNELRERGILCAPYHTHLEDTAREMIHKNWLSNKYKVVIATVAFGMGIHKPDVRFVIHYNIPKSIDHMYQESGRAGRDGKPAECIVLYSVYDALKVLANIESLREQENLYRMMRYCMNVECCRRALIGQQFSQEFTADQCNKTCDNCIKTSPTLEYNLIKPAKDLSRILQNAEKQNQMVTILKLLDAWFKKGPVILRVAKVPKPQFSRRQAENIIGHLICKQVFKISRGFNSYANISYIIRSDKKLPGFIPYSSDKHLKGIRLMIDDTNSESELWTVFEPNNKIKREPNDSHNKSGNNSEPVAGPSNSKRKKTTKLAL